jgi:radical SAM superfamily enzyme YgiQ (UPF0313 family)
MYNVILFSDLPFSYFFSRNYGIHRLATELRKYGYTVLCVNYISSLDFDSYCRLIDLAVGPDTLMVGFSSTWMPYMVKGSKNNNRAVVGHKLNMSEYTEKEHPWYFNSMAHLFTQESPTKWCNYIRQKNPKTKLTVGGCKAAGFIEFPDFDNIFIGSGDTMVIDYVNSLNGKLPKRIFNRIIDYDRNAQSPSWDFRESRTEYVKEDLVQSSEFLNIEFSRGCMFQCAFCSYPLIGQISARDIIKYKETIRLELMDNWTKWGITKYNIIDSTFNDSTEKLKAVKEVVESLPFKPKFWAYVRVDLFAVHPEQAQLIKDIGVKEILFGLESLNAATGKVIGKGHRKNSLKGLTIAKKCWGDSIFLCASAVLGLPKETIVSFEETISWYVNEGYKLIDRLGYSPLTFASSMFDADYVETSIIDRDMKKFGYLIDVDSENALNWIKYDDTDIRSREQCIKLLAKWHPTYDNVGKPDKQLFWLSGYECVDPIYRYENLDAIPMDKYFQSLTPAQDLYRKFATTLYWPQLFKILESQ